MPSADPYLAERLRKSITSRLRGHTGDLGGSYIFAVTLTRVQSDSNQSPQTVRKVLARLKYPVLLCKARSGFSILTEECLTFRTASQVIGQIKPNEEPCHAGRALRVNLCLESAV